MKVVFDTNVLISALIFPAGQAETALSRVIEEKDRLFISKPILGELLRVLARKLSPDPEALARVAVFLSDIAELVRPTRRVKALRDQADNRILQCAVAAHADAIVTGDKAMLELKQHGKARILSLQEYLGIG